MPTAEFGRGHGAQVSIVTKSGTNQFHGSVFEYLRNSNFDAADFFTNKLKGTKNTLHRNQYGATFGALIRDARVHEIRQRLAEVMPLLQGSGAAQQGVLARTHPRRRYDDRLRAAFVLPIRIAVDHRK